MRKKRLIRQIYPSFLFITLVALTAVTWYISGTFRNFFIDQTRGDLQTRTNLVRDLILEQNIRGDSPAIDELCKRLKKHAETRITVVDTSGTVLGDSDEDPAYMDNHATRPEIAAALQGKVGAETRYSRTLQEEMMYVALPLYDGDRIVGSVRSAISTSSIDKTIRAITWKIVGFGLAVSFLVAVVSLLISRKISLPLEELRHGAESFAGGDLDKPLSVSGSLEIAELADTMNKMAKQLDERIRTVVQQGEELEAILSSMVEGVLAVGSDSRILRINSAAERLLEINAGASADKPLEEVLRKADLLRFIRTCLNEMRPIEGEISLFSGGRERFLQAHGTPLENFDKEKSGVLVVLNDITRLRRLETLRRDFVANVSHELKTPVTAIKGAAETLLGGASETPHERNRFTAIVLQQADRLGEIIEDLLSLSHIEQEVETGGIPLQWNHLRPTLENAIETCDLEARKKDIRINLFCSHELQAKINPNLMEQAIVNLLTNAVKYSEPSQKIVLDASVLNNRIMIKVQDWGCGISPEHLPRLFERFYRIDKARSRKLGGTGLGLSIVKHIAQAHGGEVKVHSTPGEGSVFTLIIPLGRKTRP